MNYDIFDEQYYLSQYPWLKPAIDAGIIKSGREHFEKFGQAAGLTKISRYFDEETYLEGNPDLKPFVRTPNNPNAPFATGLDHFIQYGYEEGRTRVSPEYDEAFYVATNRDLQPFIQNGTFKNGYQHFIQFGVKDGRLPTSFFEPQFFNNEAAGLIISGTLKTPREYYFKVGQFDPTGRPVTFVGTSGNDILTGLGVGKVELIGVEVEAPRGLRRYESDGSNEFDTLIGGSGRDTFVLGDLSELPLGTMGGLSNLQQFYIGPGFATIRNFTQGQDNIQLVRTSLEELLVFPINNNRDLAIQTNGLPVVKNGVTEISSFDTLAVIEGGGNLKLNPLPDSSFFRALLG
ncbi:calcium-binding protein [Microcoleus sp. D3_18_C2]|uniref:calcium-binding protein n=1 Tax=Microcoleus sp. D3_18_C2 TaxID=3055334 RepID=UPI002FD4E4B6